MKIGTIIIEDDLHPTIASKTLSTSSMKYWIYNMYYDCHVATYTDYRHSGSRYRKFKQI